MLNSCSNTVDFYKQMLCWYIISYNEHNELYPPHQIHSIIVCSFRMKNIKRIWINDNGN